MQHGTTFKGVSKMRIPICVSISALCWACGDDTKTESAGSNGNGGAAGFHMAGGGGSGGTAGSGGGTAGSGGTAGGGGVGGNDEIAAETCETCLDPLFDGGAACETPSETCQAAATCDMWIKCYDACFNNFTAACYAACDQTHAAAMALWDPLRTCMCTPCAIECAPMCM